MRHPIEIHMHHNVTKTYGSFSDILPTSHEIFGQTFITQLFSSGTKWSKNFFISLPNNERSFQMFSVPSGFLLTAKCKDWLISRKQTCLYPWKQRYFSYRLGSRNSIFRERNIFAYQQYDHKTFQRFFSIRYIFKHCIVFHCW